MKNEKLGHSENVIENEELKSGW